MTQAQSKNKNSLSLLGRVANSFIKQKQLTFLLIMIIVVAGVTGLITLPKESLPEIIFPSLTIQTVYPGASALDVEQLITDPIEAKLSGLDNLDSFSSVSESGVSLVTLTFVEGVDIQKLELEAESLLSEINFPDRVETPDARVFKTSELPLLTYSLSGPYDVVGLTQIADQIKEALEKLPAVDEVNLSGQSSREIRVVIDTLKLYSLNMTTDDVTRALQGANINTPVGQETIGGLNTALRVDARFKTLEEVGRVLVSGGAGQAVFLSELATIEDTIKDTSQINRTYFSNNDQAQTSIYGTVLRKKGADVIGTSDIIKRVLEEGKGSLYPQDVSIGIVYDNAVNVNRDLSNIQTSALSGLLVVVLVLFLFIGFKESAIVSLTIPLSLFTTLGLLDTFGITLNTFAILGLIVALGLLVDNSIIVMENMDRMKRLGKSPVKAALEGTQQVALPILASTLTTVAAFLPLAILPGILGAFVNTIPRTIIIALVASLVISITITPSLYALIMSKQGKKTPGPRRQVFNRLVGLGFVGTMAYAAFYDPEASLLLPLVAVVFFTGLMLLKSLALKDKSFDESKLVARYYQLLTWLLAKTYRQVLVMVLALVVLVGSTLTIPLGLLKINFFPQNEPTNITINLKAPAGTPLQETLALSERVEAILVQDPEISVFNSSIGGRKSDEAVINATLTDKLDRQVSGFDVVNRIDRQLAGLTGAQITLEAAAAGGPPVGKPIAIELVAQNYEAGRRVAEDILSEIQALEGTYNGQVSVSEGAPDLVIDINAPKATLSGFSIQSLTSQIRNLLEGSVVTSLKEGQDLIDVRVMGTPSKAQALERIESLMVVTPSGQWMPLSALATFDWQQGLSAIQHEDGQRRIVIDADVREGYNASELSRQLQANLEDYQMPQGVSLTLAGDVQGIQESFLDLFRSMTLAILMVFVILTLQFKSIAQPFAIITTVPMALIGVLLGLLVTGNEFGFYAFMGLISLVGIAVNDAIVLIDFMNDLRRQGYALKDAIAQAGKTRFNPVLATTLTTIGGVLPLAFREVYYAQFSYALIFGLLVTTLMTLVLIPMMYNLIEGLKARLNKKKEVSYE